MKKFFALCILTSASVLAMDNSNELQHIHEETFTKLTNEAKNQNNSKHVTFEDSQNNVIDKAQQKWEQLEKTYLSNNKYWNNLQESLEKLRQSQFTKYINKVAQLAQKHTYITTGAVSALGYIWNGYVISCDSYMKYTNALGGAALVYLLTKKDVQEKNKKID